MSADEKEYFDHPVWECRHCGKIYHEEPRYQTGVSAGRGGTYIRTFSFCTSCAGDVVRAYDRTPLAKSVRPIAPLKGQREFRMWRWCCYSCGKSSERAFGYRSYRWPGSWRRDPVQWSIERCPVCNRENRLVYPEW